MLRRRGFTLVELMMVIAVISTLAALAVPNILAAIRTANYSNALGSLRSLSSTQLTFRNSDADGNGYADYWVGDISGMYRAAPGGGMSAGPIKMIEVSMAVADGRRMSKEPFDLAFDQTTVANNDFQPKAGYAFQVLKYYEATVYEGPTHTMPPGLIIAQEAAPESGEKGVGKALSHIKTKQPVPIEGVLAYDPHGYGRNLEHFGVIAYPTEPGLTGRIVIILSEGGKMWKADYRSRVYLSPGSNPPTATLEDPFHTFPSFPFNIGWWEKLD